MFRVTWKPSSLEGASYNDASSNEFVNHSTFADTHPTDPDAFTDAEFPAYFDWWSSTHSGTVTAFNEPPTSDEETVEVTLDQPLLGLTRVLYPYMVVQQHPSFLEPVDTFRRSVTLGGCYDYERGCRCPDCLLFHDHEADHDLPDPTCPWCRSR